MIINRAILHIFDFNSKMCVFSQKEIDLKDEVIEKYIQKHIKKILFDSGGKEGMLNSDGEFLLKLREYNLKKNDFCSFSLMIAEQLYKNINLSTPKEPMDFLFVDFTEDNQNFLGLLFLGYKKAYTHQIVHNGETIHNFLICHQAILPSNIQKLDSYAIIQKESGFVRFLDKERYIEGKGVYLLPDIILQCNSRESSKALVKSISRIAVKVAEEHEENSTIVLSKTKNFLCENAEVSSILLTEELCQEIFSESEEMQNEFLDLVQKENIPNKIKIEKAFAMKVGKSHRIKTDTGIEIVFPATYFENHEFIEFVNNPNGTIEIQIKNIGKILNK